jgi:hypothetical protein
MTASLCVPISGTDSTMGRPYLSLRAPVGFPPRYAAAYGTY